MSTQPTNHDHYLRVVLWARARYIRSDGSVPIRTGQQYHEYAVIEDLAARRYLGCRPRIDTATRHEIQRIA